MIRFKSDWAYYPGSIVDTKTRNYHFLRAADTIRKMGVEHWYFPLALLQPQLQGVDPHDEENLTTEQKTLILWEIDNNPWYYLREIVVDKSAGLVFEDFMYRATRASIAAMWATLCCVDFIRIQPRQTGKSFETDANTNWFLYYRYKDTEIHLITKDSSLRQGNIARLKKIRDDWPDFANRNTKNDDNNQQSLSCIQRGNRLYTHVSQASEKAANNVGRGMTTPYLQIDEGPFITKIKTTLGAAAGATGAAREIAERKGDPHVMAFTTTAGNKEDPDGHFIFDMMNKAAVWDESYYDCHDREELHQRLIKNSHSAIPMVNITMSHRQLGYSDEWLYERISRTRNEGDAIDRDYLNIWTSSSGQGPLADEDVRRIRRSEITPVHQEITDDQYIFRWFEEYDPNSHYALGVDTSDAIGRDDIALALTNAKSGATTGAGTYNETNITDFSHWLMKFLVKYKNVTLIIERKHNAQSIIDYLLVKLPEHGEDPFKRIYNLIVQEADKNSREYRQAIASGQSKPRDFYNAYRNKFGFVTTGGSGKNSRNYLYSTMLNTAVKQCGDRVRDGKLISQMLNLSVRNGRIDHASDAHDDMVIAWLLSHWLLHNGLNLAQYGLSPIQVFSELDPTRELDPHEAYEQKVQRQLRDEIEEIREMLKDNHDAATIHRLESQLSMKLQKYKGADDEALTLDGMLEEAAEHRQQHQKRANSRQTMIEYLKNGRF
mgnify:CR=1 FL=1